MSKLIAFRLPDSLALRLEAFATERGLSTSGAIVELLRSGLDGDESAAAPPAPKSPVPKVGAVVKRTRTRVEVAPKRRLKGFVNGEPVYYD